MKVKTESIIALLIAFLFLGFVFPAGAEVNYDISYDDPSSDVEEMDDEGNLVKVQGKDDIDIIKISSSKLTIKQNIVLEMNVAGVIVSSDNISYSFYILDQETMIYAIGYQNGIGYGTNMNDLDSQTEPDILVAAGEGTDTLRITLPINNLGEHSGYNIVGMTTMLDIGEETFAYYSDTAPDGAVPWPDDFSDTFVLITEPKFGATVFDNCEIKGISDSAGPEIQTVEIQIDGTFEDSWSSVTTSNNYYTWEYSIDTTKLGDGKHTINVRGDDGETNYFDSIPIYVNQMAASSPETMEMPELGIGEKFVYEIVYSSEDMEFVDESTITGSMTMEILRTELVEIAGKEYDVFIIDIFGKTEFGEGLFSFKTIMEGKLYVQRSDLALVYEETYTESTGSFFAGGDSTSEVITYSPPENWYDFPLTVCEKWTSKSSGESVYSYTFDGDTETETSTFTNEKSFECLRTETVTVKAGTFDTFVIYYEEEIDYDDYEEIDSDGDGWSDMDEDFFGTDPEDPMDYPDMNGNGTIMIEENSTDEYYAYDYGGYEIEYFSPETGYLVKMESYDWDRTLVTSIELVSYQKGSSRPDPASQNNQSSFTRSFGIPFELFLILVILLVIIILLSFLFVKKRRKKSTETSSDSTIGEPRIIHQTPLSTGPIRPVHFPQESTPPARLQPPNKPVPTLPVTIACPGCSANLILSGAQRPITVICPHCGVSGTVNR